MVEKTTIQIILHHQAITELKTWTMFLQEAYFLKQTTLATLEVQLPRRLEEPMEEAMEKAMEEPMEAKK